MAQLSISKEQEKQMDIIEGYPATTTREEWLAATKLYNDMLKMESVAVDPENFMGEMIKMKMTMALLAHSAISSQNIVSLLKS